MLSFYSFLCLSAGLFPCLLHVHAWELGCLERGHDLLGASKMGKDASKKMQAHQGAMFNKLGGLAPPGRFSLSLSLSLFSRACIRVSLHVLFYFPAPCLGCVPWVWQCLFNISYTLRAIPLERWQCLIYFLLCVVALCMMYVYVYVYLLVYGWLCALHCAWCMYININICLSWSM